MTVLTFTADGGTDGAALTVANSATGSGSPLDHVSRTTGDTVAYDSAGAAHGTRGIKISTGATPGYPTTDTGFGWSSSLGASAVVGGRAYLRFGATGPAFVGLFTARGSATYTSYRCSIAVNGAGQIEILDAALGVAATSTTSLPLNALCRIEWRIDLSATVGRCQVRIFTAPEGTTPAETVDTGAAANFGAATAGHFTFGLSLDSDGNQPAVVLDSVVLNNTGAFPGPFAAGAQTVSPAGIASAEAFGTAVVGRGPVTVSPAGVTSGGAYGVPTVSVGGTAVAPAGIGTAAAYGVPVVSTGTAAVSPAGIASGEAVGSPTVTGGGAGVAGEGVFYPTAPATTTNTDTATYTLGTWWWADAARTVLGIRFYSETRQPSLNPITVGLWSVDTPTTGTLLASKTLAAGSVIAPGWNEVLFDTPVNISAHPAEYMATVTTDRYAYTGSTFGTVTAHGMTAIAGVFATGTTPTFPTGGHNTWYGIDPSVQSLTAGVTVSPAGIASGQAAGTPTVTPGPVTVAPAGIASGEAVGAAVVSAAVTVSPAGIGSAEAVGVPTATAGPVTIGTAGIVTAEAVGAPTVTAAGVTLSPAGIGSGEQLGTAVVTPGPVTIGPSSIGTGEAVGTATVTLGAVTVAPPGIASNEGVGQPTLTAGGTVISPPGIGSAEQLGAPVVSAGGAIVALAGIPTGEGIGVPTITAGPVTVSPAGIGTGGAYGVPVVAVGASTVTPAGIGTAEAVGSPTITPGAAAVAPAGIPSGETVGVPALVTAGTVAPVGIPGGEAAGTPTVTPGPVTVTPAGIAGVGTFGVPTITPGPVVLTPQGIPTAEAVGTAALYRAGLITPAGVPTAAAVGTPTITGGAASTRGVLAPTDSPRPAGVAATRALADLAPTDSR